MSVLTVEGVVEGDKIRLINPLDVPDDTRVYVVVPDVPAAESVRIYSPRLRHPDQIADFGLEVSEAPDHDQRGD